MVKNVKTPTHINIFGLFPLYKERLRRMVKYGRLHARIIK
jgi:hypothetical protein